MPSRISSLLNGLTGWLFLAAGMAMLACVALVPVMDDLEKAKWRRAQAEALLEHKRERLDNYSTYLEALDRQDETVMKALAATQLNLAPADRTPVWMDGDIDHFNASVFDDLEPAPVVMPRLGMGDSTLRNLIEGDTTRMLMIVGGALCVLIGVLPPASRESARGRLPRPLRRSPAAA